MRKRGRRKEKKEWWVRKEEERSWNKCKDGNSQIGEGQVKQQTGREEGHEIKTKRKRNRGKTKMSKDSSLAPLC